MTPSEAVGSSSTETPTALPGDDEQVLLAQVTTDGMLSGSLYVQVFVNGNPNDDNRILLDLEDACVAPGGPEACEFPDEGYDCDGNMPQRRRR